MHLAVRVRASAPRGHPGKWREGSGSVGPSGSVGRRAWTLTWGLSCAWRVFACDTQRGSGLGQTLPLRARGSWRGRDPLPRLFLRSCVLGSLRCPPGPVWAADSHMPSAGHARLGPAPPRPCRGLCVGVFLVPPGTRKGTDAPWPVPSREDWGGAIRGLGVPPLLYSEGQPCGPQICPEASRPVSGDPEGTQGAE